MQQRHRGSWCQQRGRSGAEPPSTRVQHDGDDGSTVDDADLAPGDRAGAGRPDDGRRDPASLHRGRDLGERRSRGARGQADWLPLAQLDVFASLVGTRRPTIHSPRRSIMRSRLSQMRATSLFASAPRERPRPRRRSCVASATRARCCSRSATSRTSRVARRHLRPSPRCRRPADQRGRRGLGADRHPLDGERISRRWQCSRREVDRRHRLDR